jgi:hypothetical protein
VGGNCTDVGRPRGHKPGGPTNSIYPFIKPMSRSTRASQPRVRSTLLTRRWFASRSIGLRGAAVPGFKPAHDNAKGAPI